MSSKEKSIESAFEEINKIIEEMDKSQVSLEDSFRLYNDGIKLVQFCNEKIEKVEKAITILETEND